MKNAAPKIRSLTDLLIEHSDVAKLIDLLGKGPAVEVFRMRHAPSIQNQCYRNTSKLVQELGGKTDLGWHLLHWPGKYLVAQHHAVWMPPEGSVNPHQERVDSTPPATLRAENRIAFVSDPTAYPNVGPDPMVEDKVIILNDRPLVKDVIAAYQRAHRGKVALLSLAGGIQHPLYLGMASAAKEHQIELWRLQTLLAETAN